jgi:hypothetical protein
MGSTVMESRLSLCYILSVESALFVFSLLLMTTIMMMIMMMESAKMYNLRWSADRDGILNVSVAIKKHNLLEDWAASMEMPFTLSFLWRHL